MHDERQVSVPVERGGIEAGTPVITTTLDAPVPGTRLLIEDRDAENQTPMTGDTP